MYVIFGVTAFLLTMCTCHRLWAKERDKIHSSDRESEQITHKRRAIYFIWCAENA